MNDKTSVLIVDDSGFMVREIHKILESDPSVEVVGTARNGEECLSKIKELHPDVITLDVDMPVMDGLRAVRHIMIESPVPVVMLSSLAMHGDITFEALRLGVVDFLPKPSGAVSRDIHDARNQIIDRVKIATSVTMENIKRVKLNVRDATDELAERYAYQSLDYLIAIGTSLGGPNTIIRLMSKLSPALPAAAVIAQEISPKILPAFAEKFAEHSSWRVEAAEEGRLLEQGVCYISSIQQPLVIGQNFDGQPCLVHAEQVNQPLNELFTSAAQVYKQNAVGVLLTGIGDDGSEGFADIRANSGVTIAQSTNTCVYPNLTRCAIENGVADYVVDESALAKQIVELVDQSIN